MKKTKIIIFSLIIGSVASQSFGNRHEEKLAPLEIILALNERHYAPTSEGFYRKILYKMFVENPYFYKMNATKKDREYYVCILKDHIKKLERKIAQNKKGIVSWSTAKGTFSLSLAALSGCAFYWFYSTKLNFFNFNNNSYDQYRWEDERNHALVGLGLSTFGCSCFAAKFFRKVWRYKERLQERLKRDQELLALFEG